MCVLLYNTKIRNNGWKLIDSNTVPGDDVLWFLFFQIQVWRKDSALLLCEGDHSNTPRKARNASLQ